MDAVDRLTANMAHMTILDRRRKDKNQTMPEVGLVVEFEQIAVGIGGWSLFINPNTLKKRMISMFGAIPLVMAKLWELMEEYELQDDWPKGVQKKHLCWSLHKIKVYSDESIMCTTMNGGVEKGRPDEKTFRKWTDFMIGELTALEPYLILWENRKTNDEGRDILAGVDTMDCKFQQIKIPDPNNQGKMIVSKALYTYKFRGPALRYEVASAVDSNHIVWVSGPYPPGDYNDLTIFRCGLINMLEPNERIAADKIYNGEAPRKVVCQGMIGDMTGDREQWLKRAEGRIENIMKRLKTSNCLVVRFKGRGKDRVQKHSDLFRACAVTLQTAMDMGTQELYKI